jgi:hypothetical protein
VNAEGTNRWAGLRDAAIAVLRANDRGAFTQPAAGLYPHQWSWDSAITAVGWAHIDLPRAIAEIDATLAAQWTDGRMPHLIFHPEVEGAEIYRPGPDFWDAARAATSPAEAITSGLAAPPVHALAVRRVWQIGAQAGGEARRAADDLVGRSFAGLLAWHRYLARERDPTGSGLITIHHPWESWDNSPQWDGVLARLEVGSLAPHLRRDVGHVGGAAERPSETHYSAYRWLVDLLKAASYDDAVIRRSHPFQVRDISVSALLLASNEALLELAAVAGAGTAARALIAGWIAAGRRGLDASWDEDRRLCLSRDLGTGRQITARTVSGLAPLFAASLPAELREALQATLDSRAFAGDPRLRWPLPPSTSPLDPAFEPLNYWRGPVWPVVNWLLWTTMRTVGAVERAERLRRDALDQIAAGGFAEYFEPFSGQPLGARTQSWTAAAAIDWLSAVAPAT